MTFAVPLGTASLLRTQPAATVSGIIKVALGGPVR
jgi:hypothetical protein